MSIDPCKNEALLSALMDDELSAEQGEAVQLHIKSCSSCRRKYEALLKTNAMIRNMDEMEPSAGFDLAFWRRVDELESRGRGLSRLASLLTGWRPALATGIVAAVMAIFFIYFNQDKKLSQEDIFIAQNMELLQNYDLIDDLDILEQLEAMENIEEPS